MVRAKALADVVTGPHCPTTEWVFRAVQLIAAGQSDRLARIVDRLDDIQFDAPPRPIFLTHYPAPELIAAIADGDTNVLYVIDDPIDVLRYQTKVLNVSPTESIRAQTSSAVANLAIGRAERVSYVRRESNKQISRVIEAIAAHLNIKLGAERATEISQEMSGGLGPSACLEDVLKTHLETYAPPVRSVGGGVFDQFDFCTLQVVDPMISMAFGDHTRPIIWPTQAFSFTDQPAQPTMSTTDISGPVRNIFYGPYFHLPPARYRMEALIAFSHDVRDIPFSIEVVGKGLIARARIADRRADNFRGFCEFTYTNPIDTIEVRLRNDQVVEKGQLRLVEMAFFTRSNTSAEPI